ncbi:hypothetical protein Bca52824_008002 [Brassica carinata]|uniref:Uncharacterized protein n=1 Tax=Brassica carinata TaxID=52824 RepID=A0A8X7W7A7_BRACI|nr:hypothetical protein Bca52824_008002 [Brassica carinata]
MSKTEAHKQPTRWPKRHKPHILHLDSLASLIDFSVSLSFSGDQKLRRAHRFVFSDDRLFLNAVFTEMHAFSDSRSSLSRPGCNVSPSIPRTKTRSRLHRRSSSPEIALTAFTIENPGSVCSSHVCFLRHRPNLNL